MNRKCLNQVSGKNAIATSGQVAIGALYMSYVTTTASGKREMSLVCECDERCTIVVPCELDADYVIDCRTRINEHLRPRHKLKMQAPTVFEPHRTTRGSGRGRAQHLAPLWQRLCPFGQVKDLQIAANYRTWYCDDHESRCYESNEEQIKIHIATY